MKIYPKYSLSENEIKTIYSSFQTVKTGCCSNKTAGPVTFPRDTAIDYQSGKLIFNTFFPMSLLSFFENGSHCRDDSGLGAAGCCGHRDDSREGGSGGEEGGLCQGHWHC